MIELLILAVLHDKKNTIYKIKKNIDEKCGIFHQVSFGAIYPIIKKLEENKHILAKKSLSKGGQKSSVYSLSNTGKEHFVNLMKDNTPENISSFQYLISIKLLLLSYLNDQDKLEAVGTIIQNLESKLFSGKNFLNNNTSGLNDLNLKFMNYNIYKLEELIEWIKNNYQ